MTSVLAFLAEQPVLLVFLLIGIGMALGGIKTRGISLGAAAVLFLGIAFRRLPPPLVWKPPYLPFWECSAWCSLPLALAIILGCPSLSR